MLRYSLYVPFVGWPRRRLSAAVVPTPLGGKVKKEVALRYQANFSGVDMKKLAGIGAKK
jgi:hypothetical protein